MQGTLRGVGMKAARAAIGMSCALAFLASSAQAAAPSIQRTAVSGVTTTTALFEATIDPGGALTHFHFEYGPQDCSVGPCTSVPAPEGKVPAEVKGSGDLTGKGKEVSEEEARTVRNVTTTAGAFGVGDAISGAGIPANTIITAVDPAAKTLTLSREATASGTGVALTATGPQPVSVPVSGLQPATLYHYRVVAKNTEESKGPDHVFATFGQTIGGLPDGRAYEQASPVNKDGGDAEQQQSLTKATPSGSGITYGSNFGMPNGKGAQELPIFLASRGLSNWSSEGLLPPVIAGEPPVTVGERTTFIGWSPDYSRLYSKAIKFAVPPVEGLVEQSGQADPIVIGPYAPNAHYYFSGEGPGGSVVFFEASVKLPPKAGKPPIADATEGIPNLYAWDRASGEVSLVGVFNPGEGPAAPKGSFAGPYDWSLGSSAFNLHEGGAERTYYLEDMHAITPEGDVYFTAAGSGQLYLRRNPTEPQSSMQSGKCSEPELACTLHVSVSKRTTPDPAGEAPAAFQAASKDGSKVFFTSHEMLTDNANTGPEQLPPAIARDTSDGDVNNIEANFLPKRAVGVTRFGSWIYWANPTKGAIGRAKLNAQEELEGTPDEEFIVIPPSEGECEEEPDPIKEPGVFKLIADPIPAEPRYLAVEGEHIYWTNTGRRDSFNNPIDGGGTIGRAELNGEAAASEIEPAFICGEEESQPKERLVSNPQGIAVNSEHIYWANAAQDAPVRRIARANIDGSEVKAKFIDPGVSRFPYGLALDSEYLYFAADEPQNNNGFISRAALEGESPDEGGTPEVIFIGEEGVRGVAIEAGNLYWTTQGEGGWVGRIALSGWKIGLACAALPGCNRHFIDVEGSPNGIAAGAEHLFWSTNGESAGNPGNDLYRYQPGTDTLEDLTSLPVLPGDNGAEVQGVLGVSADGSYLYFAANGVPAGTAAEGATQGTCKGSVQTASGKCNLYAWHEGQVRFVARLNAENGADASDALDWVGAPFEVQASGSYRPKTAQLGEGGAVLVFRSQEQLTAYANEGVPEFYRYRAAEPGKVICLTCRPSGEVPGGGPRIGSRSTFPGSQPIDEVKAVQSRSLSADGDRFFFQTAEALSPTDTDGAGDVYEWEAPSPTCQEGAPSYSFLNEGCIYLISSGKSEFPSFFGDASEDGSSVFFFTRQQLVGQDKDELQDVYDARVGGGLAAQNQVPPPACESAEACHGPAPTPPAEGSPTTSNFSGPGNQVEKHKKPKKQKHHKKKQKHHKKKQKHHKHKQKQQRHKAKAGGGR